jgi:hypothetical protein
MEINGTEIGCSVVQSFIKVTLLLQKLLMRAGEAIYTEPLLLHFNTCRHGHGDISNFSYEIWEVS